MLTSNFKSLKIIFRACCHLNCVNHVHHYAFQPIYTFCQSILKVCFQRMWAYNRWNSGSWNSANRCLKVKPAQSFLE